MKALLEEIFAPFGVTEVGTLPWDKLPALLPVGSRRRLPKEAKSVLFALFPYYVGEYPGRNLSRYAILPDYHSICMEILTAAGVKLGEKFPGHSFVPFVDASPIPEVEGARLAGLGVVGRNGQLIHPTLGSLFFIGELVTDLELPTLRPPLEGGCLGCGRCLAVCPGGALTGAGLDLSRCRSHITQKKGALTPEEAALVAGGPFIWGCDLCTDCCPHNENPLPTPILGFYEGILPHITGENLDRALQNRAMSYRGRQVLERNLALLGKKMPPEPSPRVEGVLQSFQNRQL